MGFLTDGEAREMLNKGYSHGGASYTKRALKGFNVSSGSPSEDIDANNDTLRQRSRMLYMAAPIATAALKRQRTNVVGSGLKLKCAIDRELLKLDKDAADQWQRRVQREFELWAGRKQSCDATGVNNFYAIQQLAALSWPMSGDVFVLIKRAAPTALSPYTLRLHLLEADRVRTPAAGRLWQSAAKGRNPQNGNLIFDGVEVDRNGAIAAYHVANTYPWQIDGGLTEFVRIPAYGEATGLPNILQIMDSERPEQYRGVPYLAQAIEPLLQLKRYTEAEIMAAVVQGFYTAFVTTGNPSEMPFGETAPESRDPSEYRMGSGTVNIMAPGEDVKFATPTHPNTGFDTFMRSMCEQVGAALEIPADLLLMSFNSSYSASRGALLEAWKGFRMRREWLTDDFCRPVYEVWLTEAVALGRVSAPGFFTDPAIRQAYLGSEWIGPPQGQLDPTKEIAAAVMAIANGLSTHESESIRVNGSQFNSNVDQLIGENQRLRQAEGRGG